MRRCLDKSVVKRLPHIGVARLELGDIADTGSAVESPPRLTPVRVSHLILAAGAGIAATAASAWLLWPATPAIDAPPPMHVAVPMPNATTAANGVLLSPDGRYLATRGSSGVSMLHVFAGTPSQPLDGIAGCWSPDSRSLVLLRANGDLVRMNLAGGPAAAFTNGPTTGSGCTWGRAGVLLLGGGRERFIRVTTSEGTHAPGRG